MPLRYATFMLYATPVMLITLATLRHAMMLIAAMRVDIFHAMIACSLLPLLPYAVGVANIACHAFAASALIRAMPMLFYNIIAARLLIAAAFRYAR